MQLDDKIASFMDTPGLLGCALVEGGTGMVITSAGQLPDMTQIGETAVEFWRLHWRLNSLLSAEFGSLLRQACFFQNRVLALMPWEKNSEWLLVFVAVPGKIDWAMLHKKIVNLV